MAKRKNPGFLLVISGPSGAGKGTIIEALRNRFDDISLVTSWTTRKPRPGEKPDVDYKFVTKEEFQEKVQAKGFLEWAIVYDHFYGTPIEDVETHIKQGKILVLEIDVQGARSIRTNPMVDEVSLFIIPPDRKTLYLRLKNRGTEDEEELEIRLKQASREIEEARLFDYIIINDELETAFNDAEMAIRGEFHRSRRVFDQMVDGYLENQ